MPFQVFLRRGREQRLLGREAPVDGADTDAGLLGHVVMGRGHPARGERLTGGLDDASPVCLRITPQRPARSCLGAEVCGGSVVPDLFMSVTTATRHRSWRPSSPCIAPAISPEPGDPQRRGRCGGDPVGSVY
ncbi:hypothetical protein [Micromonospora wenchangensis]|uniref:hypothetical protein n=1 Tax=Micromonospora wenchangensis TaxID=1185415 RepID=UPI00380CADB3